MMLTTSFIYDPSLSSTLQPQNIIQNFEQVAILVLKSLDDQNNRVLWATMHAIRRLSECKKLLLRAQFQMKFFEKLVPIIKSNSCARVLVRTY